MVRRVEAVMQAMAHRFGFEVRRYSRDKDIDVLRMRLLSQNSVSMVLDVGAYVGGYARQLRDTGYKGRIVSFEPLSNTFAHLSQHAAADTGWECLQLALGNLDGPAIMNIAGNWESSSILPMCKRHVAVAPATAYVGTETVTMARLDSLCSELLKGDESICLKLDVQGYELEALRGASHTLSKVWVLEMELSLVPLYEDQPLFCQMIEYANLLGFDLVWLESGVKDPVSGHLLQMDGLFVRRSSPCGDAKRKHAGESNKEA